LNAGNEMINCFMVKAKYAVAVLPVTVAAPAIADTVRPGPAIVVSEISHSVNSDLLPVDRTEVGIGEARHLSG